MAKSEIPQRIDPFLMSVLASRFEAIIREMTNTVMFTSLLLNGQSALVDARGNYLITVGRPSASV